VDRNAAREDAARDSVDDVSRLFLCVARNQPDICHQSQNNENEAENACGNQSHNIFFGLRSTDVRGSSSEAKSKNENEKKTKAAKLPRAARRICVLSAAKLLAVSERAAEQKCRSVASRNS